MASKALSDQLAQEALDANERRFLQSAWACVVALLCVSFHLTVQRQTLTENADKNHRSLILLINATILGPMGLPGLDVPPVPSPDKST